MKKMEANQEEFALKGCLYRIEQDLGWGDASLWSTKDFESLSDQILERTSVNLSVATLKRLFGKVRYDSRPTATTLDALAVYQGYENWRAFVQRFSSGLTGHEKDLGVDERKYKFSRRIAWIWGTPIVGLILGFVGFNFLANKPAPATANPEDYSFSIKRMVPSGVPNSVLFHYDAKAAQEGAKIFIQQSWDARLRKPLAADEDLHTSIYYYPGYFLAKLVVDDQIVKEEGLFIKSGGWVSMLETQETPVYLDTSEGQSESLCISTEKVLQQNVQLQPEAPWTSFHLVDEFAGAMSDNFVFEANIKNDYSEGANACQNSEVHILLEGGAIIIPLSTKGCVGQLEYYDGDGSRQNPEVLGVDFSDWVKVKVAFNGANGELVINEKSTLPLTYKFGAKQIVGFRIRFQGAGSLDEVRLSDHAGTMIYEESFDGSSPL